LTRKATAPAASAKKDSETFFIFTNPVESKGEGQTLITRRCISQLDAAAKKLNYNYYQMKDIRYTTNKW